jgi:hypothetical protein
MKIDPANYDELLNNSRIATNVADGGSVNLSSLTLEPWDVRVLEIK